MARHRFATLDGVAEAYDPGAELERLRSLIACDESSLGVPAQYLIVPQEGVAYATGTVLPLIGAPSPTRRPAEGVRLPGGPPASDDYMGTYVTLDEYVPAAAAIDLQSAADGHRRESLITALVTVNRIVDDESQLATLTEAFMGALRSDVEQQLKAAMRIPSGGMGRRIVAAHPLLMSMRWLIGRPPLSEPIADETSGLHAVLFSHLIATKLLAASSEEDGDDAHEEMMKRLMLAWMNLGILSEDIDVYASIDRTVRLWNQYGHLTEAGLGRHAATLFVECAGMTVEALLAVGCALLAHAVTWKPGVPVLLQPTIHDEMPAELRERGLAILSRSLQESYETVGDPTTEYDLLAIESRPVLELSRGLAVLDRRLLWRRCTSGLYWIVHDALKSNSDEEAGRFREAHGDMIEALVEDSLRAMAPPVVGGGQTYYTEDDLATAYGKVTRRRCDAVIDFGNSLLLVEIVGGRLSVPARVSGDLSRLEDDFDRLVLDKCEQLHQTAKLLLADEEPLTGIPRGQRFPQLVPALVVGGGFPLNPLSYSYIRWRMKELGYLQHRRVAPLSVLDLDDIDELEGLAEKGFSVAELLGLWQASDLGDVPLGNFILRQQLPDERRPTRMKASVDATFRDVIGRVGFTNTSSE